MKLKIQRKGEKPQGKISFNALRLRAFASLRLCVKNDL
jgi:hypothetical protein